ncbi:MAG: hypothetical protein E4H02_10735 [Lentisphaerales bacterium]|jgi:hypothetical protein|nr:MAG: hypothetical protein E4H02_10735 [Lentisphaerales bacterium]
MTRKLKTDNTFCPHPIREDDEFFANGIFEFNITRMLEHIEHHPADIPIVAVDVSDFHSEFSSLNESHVDTVDVSRPVILAEISPGHCNLIDGNHRMEKARRAGITKMKAYKFSVRQHIAFLTSKKSYLSYVEYWNSKLD